MYRIIEPEIMDDEAQVAAYAGADFSDSNRWFVDSLLESFPQSLAHVADLGCGPGDIAIQLVRTAAGRVTAVDGSVEMLNVARRAVQAAGLQDRITLHLARLPDPQLPEHGFDAVLSKDMLHHLADPQVLWEESKRLVRPGGAIQVMDLVRPTSAAAARQVVERVSAGEHPLLKEDFFNSLCAAFTIDEVREQLQVAGLRLDVAQVTDRHMRVSGLMT
jgi:ubiquinone/menaquinone biosynthesis C-methylase UbiE